MKQRSEAKERLLKLYRTKPVDSKKSSQPLESARIEPDRRWFGNTRLITQEKLDRFREVVTESKENPYHVLLKKTRLPHSLLDVSQDKHKSKRSSHLLALESYEKTFGKNKVRKRPKLEFDSINQMARKASEIRLLASELVEDTPEHTDAGPKAQPEEIFKKGTSKRIWQELYKVIDSSDVVIEVLDARNPVITRCLHLEKSIRKDRPHKHIVLVLNKCDLVPAWCAQRWLKILSSEFPTVAFHSSLKNSFGKMTLINLLRQYAGLMKERQHVSVGFIGYPNVGKSSVINTLRAKKVCVTAPVPGQTKVWQYVSLTRRIHLIDCPGIVPFRESLGPAEKVLNGVVRAEKVQNPEQHIPTLMTTVDRKTLSKVYSVPDTWTSPQDFLEMIAKKKGKLLKGGLPDIPTVSRIMIYDYQRGVIPYYLPPPDKTTKLPKAIQVAE